MTKLYRVLGKRGRITIPFEIRQRVGFTYNDVLSFTESPDGRTVTVKREKICDNCSGTKTADKEAEMTLEDFLDSLSAEQQRVALVHLSYDGERLCFCANEVIEKYGFDRVNFVLAATVRQGTHDGRYSEDNKKWSKRFSVMDKENAWQYCVRSHPGLVNLFVSDTRRQWDKLGLYDGSQCDSERSGQLDYTDRILVLNPSVLKDECKTPQNQLFYATHGNGCRPDSLGTKVFGFHVSDGEKTYYRRDEFIGALKEEFIPEWAKGNTPKHLEPDEPADEPVEDGGMTLGGM